MTKMEPPPPVHPGEVLREQYLAPLGITPCALAAALRLSRTHVERLVREEISLTPGTAMRLAGYFATSPDFWLAIQARFDKHALMLPVALTQLDTPKQLVSSLLKTDHCDIARAPADPDR